MSACGKRRKEIAEYVRRSVGPHLLRRIYYTVTAVSAGGGGQDQSECSALEWSENKAEAGARGEGKRGE